MDFNISLKFEPSQWFLGILAELNERYADWTDGSYDWANQTTDFLHNPVPVPKFDEAIFRTPLSQRAINDLLHVAIAMLAGDYPMVRRYLGETHFAFVIGYPRSGGSYLTKELLRTVGLDHTRVSEALAHDGFPEMRDIWYDWKGDRPYFHLQDSIFQAAEFLVISSLYYRRKTTRHPHGHWLVPKKMHKLTNWGGSFKMLLGQGKADYLVTIRNPLPAAISIAEKSGGMPEDRRFPTGKARSAIEHWVLTDLMMLGHSMAEIAAMDYLDAICRSWSNFHARMATSGLFLGARDEIRIIAYGEQALQEVVRGFRAGHMNKTPPEEVLTHEKAQDYPGWHDRAAASVESMARLWGSLGLAFPELSLA